MDKLIFFLTGILVALSFIAFVPSPDLRELTRCKDAVLADIPIIWEEDYPFCIVEVTINGKVKEVTLKDYYEYTK
jgi:hypothetical protein